MAAAHASHDVPEGICSVSTKSISWEEFARVGQCDRVISSQVKTK